jgi:hypothetical protein
VRLLGLSSFRAYFVSSSEVMRKDDGTQRELETPEIIIKLKIKLQFNVFNLVSLFLIWRFFLTFAEKSIP